MSLHCGFSSDKVSTILFSFHMEHSMKTTIARLWRRSLVLAILVPIFFAATADAQPGGPRGGFPRRPWLPGGPPSLPGETVYVWRCGNCKAILGETRSELEKPNIARCPRCGVWFRHSAPGGSGGWNRPAPPTGQSPPRNDDQDDFAPPPNDQGGAQAPGNQGDFQPPAEMQPTFKPAQPTSGASSAPAPAAKSSRSVSILVVVVIVGLVVLTGLIALSGGVIWMISTAPSAGSPKPPKAKRRPTSSSFERI